MALTWPLEREGHPSSAPLTIEPIKTVQYLLRQDGHTNVAVDGIFGPITASAVKDFQSAHALSADGEVGNPTWPALIVQILSGSRGEAVRGVQSQFQARNLSGDPSRGLQIDGIFGPQTEAAVRSFQQAVGLNVDAIVGPVTWNSLVNGALALWPDDATVAGTARVQSRATESNCAQEAVGQERKGLPTRRRSPAPLVCVLQTERLRRSLREPRGKEAGYGRECVQRHRTGWHQ